MSDMRINLVPKNMAVVEQYEGYEKDMEDRDNKDCVIRRKQGKDAR